MYRNLEAEMARAGITRKAIAEHMELRYATLVDKLSGKYPLKLDEAITIKTEFFPSFSLEYLFEKDNEEATAR